MFNLKIKGIGYIKRIEKKNQQRRHDTKYGGDLKSPLEGFFNEWASHCIERGN